MVGAFTIIKSHIYKQPDPEQLNKYLFRAGIEPATRGAEVERSSTAPTVLSIDAATPGPLSAPQCPSGGHSVCGSRVVGRERHVSNGCLSRSHQLAGVRAHVHPVQHRRHAEPHRVAAARRDRGLAQAGRQAVPGNTRASLTLDGYMLATQPRQNG